MAYGSGCIPFPRVRWQTDDATFLPGPFPEDAPAVFALVFPFYGDRIVLAEIPERGWCIPSGRVERGETSRDAAIRECFEESGATLTRLAPLGRFQLTDTRTGEVRFAAAYLGDVGNLEDLPEGSESQGRILLGIEEVEGAYFAWDALLAAVFAHAEEARPYLLPAGTPLSDLTGESV